MTEESKVVANGTQHTDAGDGIHTILLRSEQASAGIKESQDVLVFADRLGDYLRQAYADKKFDQNDLFGLLGISGSLMAAVNGSSQIPHELKSMTGEEKDALIIGLKNALFKIVGVFI